jgi:hypothetical protein
MYFLHVLMTDWGWVEDIGTVEDRAARKTLLPVLLMLRPRVHNALDPWLQA